MNRRMAVSLVLCVFLAAGVQAATVTAPLNIYAEVLEAGTCTVDGGSVFFVVTPPVTAPIDQTGWFQVLCPSATPYEITMSAGGAGNYDMREMSGVEIPANKVFYNVFTDTTFGVIWGDGSGSTGTVSSTGTGVAQPFYPGVRILSQPTPAAGNYSDSVVITVTY